MPAFPEDAPPDLSAFDDGRLTAPSKRKRSTLLIVLVAVLPVLAAIGGGAWWMLREPSDDEPSAEEQEMAEAEEEEEEEAKPVAKKKDAQKGKKDKKDKKKAAPKAEPIYQSLAPAFVVNLSDDEAMRYLQLEAEIMSRDALVVDKVKKNMPAIRNNILMLLGTKRYHELLTREDKEKLQLEMLAEIRKVIEDDAKEPRVEAIFFTNFVSQ